MPFMKLAHDIVARQANRALACLALAPFIYMAGIAPSDAQDREAQRASVNNDTVMIAAGPPSTLLMRAADDLAIALNDPESGFRILPVAGAGAASNIRDLILLRQIDLALTDLTVLREMNESRELSQMLTREIAQVVTLFENKLALLARRSVESIEALDGKRIAVGLQGSDSATHAEKIFQALGIGPELVYMGEMDAAIAVSEGAVEAFACFCLTSTSVYQKVMFDPDLHMLPIGYASELRNDYQPAFLTHEEFPAFIGRGQTVETVGVTLALVTYNWEKGSPRYARVAKFVERFLNNLPKLQQPPRHRGWASLNIGDEQPGWPRFAAVTEWQAANKGKALQEMRVAFGEFLDRWAPEVQEIAPNQRTQLFEEFLEWRGRQQP